MPSQEVLTLLIDAKNLASAQLKGLQKDLRGASDDSDRMNAALRRGGVIAQGVLAAGFGLAAKGAAELSDVQGRLQAETGKSAEEAHRMALAVNEIAGATATDLPAVSAAFSKVVTDIGATGEAAKTLTDQFVLFGKVTGQDASAAVTAFDDILDAWGLQASDATSVMDKLVVEHQKYGGVVAQNQAVLKELAPAMTAANMKIDDAIGLLALFDAKGVDASVAVRGLQTALQKVKSPQELQTMLQDIADTSDGFARAQKAADLFGAKGGAKLGAALAGANLGEYTQSILDSAGASKKAGDAIENTFPEQIKRALSSAQSAIRGFGDMFGSTLMSLMFAGQLWTTISSAFGFSLAGAIRTAMAGTVVETALTAAGQKIAAGIAIGIAAAPAAIPLAIVTMVQEGLRNALSNIPGWIDFRKAATQMEQPAKQAGEQAGASVTDGTTAALTQGRTDIVANMTTTMQKVSTAIRSARADVQAAWKTVLDGAISTANAKDQVIVNNAEIAAQKAIIGDKSRTAAEKAEARIRLRNLQADNAALQKEIADSGDVKARIAYVKGQLTSKQMMDGLKSKDPVIRDNWAALRDSLESEMRELEEDAYTLGYGVGVKFGSGIGDSTNYVGRQATFMVGMARDFLKTGSPAKRGPFSEQGGPDGMGRHLGEMWAKGLGNATLSVRASAGKLASSAQEPLGPRAATSAPTRAAAAPAGGGSVHLHVSSMFPPSQAQISQWADLLDREFRRRQPRFSAYANGA